MIDRFREALRPLPWPEVAHLPAALVQAAGFALHPRLAAIAHVARQEVLAGHPVLAVRRGDRRDRAARAGARVLPRHAAVLAAAGQKLGDGGTGDLEVVLGR